MDKNKVVFEAAKAHGVAVPLGLPGRADEVIE